MLKTVIAHLPDVVVEGEVARRVLGEDLGHGPLEGVRHLAVVEEEVEVLELLLAGSRPAGPLVLVRGVVDHDVEGEQHAPLAHRPGKPGEVLGGTDPGIDATEVADRVAAVPGAFRTGKDRAGRGPC